MRTHTYVVGKGYDEQYKGREVKWQVPETVAEALSSGEFADEKTLVKYAVAQLNIKKGHAIQDATKEVKSGPDGKPTTELAFPNMSLKDMERVAAEVKAEASERTRGTGNVKARAANFDTAKQKAKTLAASGTLSDEKRALLRELGMLDEDEAPAAPVAAPATAGTARAARPTK